MKYLIVILLLLVGCSQQPRVALNQDVAMGNTQIAYELGKDGIYPIILSDAMYVMPSKEWIDWNYTAWRRLQRAAGLIMWHRRWDCDNFARDFQMYCSKKFAKLPESSKAEGIAIFVRHYISTKGAHAINVIYTDDYKVEDFEPQNGIWLQLLKSERSDSKYVGD